MRDPGGEPYGLESGAYSPLSSSPNPKASRLAVPKMRIRIILDSPELRIPTLQSRSPQPKHRQKWIDSKDDMDTKGASCFLKVPGMVKSRDSDLLARVL